LGIVFTLVLGVRGVADIYDDVTCRIRRVGGARGLVPRGIEAHPGRGGRDCAPLLSPPEADADVDEHEPDTGDGAPDIEEYSVERGACFVCYKVEEGECPREPVTAGWRLGCGIDIRYGSCALDKNGQYGLRVRPQEKDDEGRMEEAHGQARVSYKRLHISVNKTNAPGNEGLNGVSDILQNRY
jgi:hypothetical protein